MLDIFKLEDGFVETCQMANASLKQAYDNFVFHVADEMRFDKLRHKY